MARAISITHRDLVYYEFMFAALEHRHHHHHGHFHGHFFGHPRRAQA